VVHFNYIPMMSD